jgi:hypothetical protein
MTENQQANGASFTSPFADFALSLTNLCDALIRAEFAAARQSKLADESKPVSVTTIEAASI